MANLLCESNINFTSSSWKILDTSSFLNSEASSTNTTTSYVASQTFSPGAITIEGIMIKYRYVVNNSGTLSVELYNTTGASSVPGSEVTINVSDIAFWMKPGGAQNGGGFIYFKFSSPITLSAATNYSVRIKSSINGSVSINRNATANNWSRALVTTSTASPSTDDVLYACGAFTGISTPSFITCILDNTSSTIFGGVELGGYSKLVLQNNPSTAYVLKIKNAGNFIISLNSEVEFGTSTSRVNSTSSFLLEMQATGLATNLIDIRATAKFTAYGADVKRMTTLSSDVLGGATTLTTDDITGWKSGDEIALANTIRSASDLCERKSLTANAVGNTLTISAITNARSGTNPTKCDIGNLTSNVKIYGSSTTGTCHINNGNSAMTLLKTTVNIDNVEFRYLGANLTNKNGFIFSNDVNTVCNITNCSFSDMETVIQTTNVPFNNLVFSNCVIYNSKGLGIRYTSINGSGKELKILNNLIINPLTSGIVFYNCGDSEGVTVSNNIISGSSQYPLLLSTMTTNLILTGFKIYGNRNVGISFDTTDGITLYNFNVFFNNSPGMAGGASSYMNVNSFNIFGNGSYNINFNVGSQSYFKKSIFKNCNINSHITYNTLYGVYVGSGSKIGDTTFQNCNFGTETQHTAADVYEASGFGVVFNNCNFGSPSLLSSVGGGFYKAYSLFFQKINGVIGNHRCYNISGVLINDSTIFYSSPYSQRMVPGGISIGSNSRSIFKLESTSFQVPVNLGETCTFSIMVRKSGSSDGTAYNGNPPRLVLKSNPSAGTYYNNDIICATHSASAGLWEKLSYTLPVPVTDNVAMEFYVDCDGSQGWINVDSVEGDISNALTNYINGSPTIVGKSSSKSETSCVFIT